MNNIEAHRSFIDKNGILSIKERIRQLRKLYKVLKARSGHLEEALNKDLGKHPTEGYASEIGLVLEEIRYTINNIHSWAEVKSFGANIGLFPTRNKVYPVPKGLALIIAPWNYPVQLVFAPLVAAIAAGCCAIVKPSEDAINCERLIKSVIEDTFESEYISCITGIGADVIPPIIKSGKINHVFFTGSTVVGKIIAQLCAEQLITSTLELGGKSPAIVEQSANLKIAAKRITWGKFYNTGQTCVAPDYVLVHKSQKKEFIKYAIDAIEEFYGKNQKNSESYGRIINERRFRVLESYLRKNNIVYGGETDAQLKYISPTIIDNVALDNSIMNDEIFGPLLPIITYENQSEIFKAIKSNSNPLALYVFTKSRRFEKEIIETIPFGGGAVNNTLVQLVSNETPFGGIGASGWGSYHGKAGFKEFTHFKGIAKTGTWLDIKLKYPPYSSLKNKLVRLFLK